MKKRTLLTLLPSFIFACAVSVAAQDGGATQQKPYTIEQNELKLTTPVVFADRSDKLLPQSEKALTVVKDYLGEKKAVTLLRIEGHTDASDDAVADQQLSERRALSVARWLLEKGVDCKRLIAVGFGSTKPVASNDTPEHKAQNLRITFVNAALLGRAIGGMPADGGGRAAGDLCPKP
ncbi:MAG TPA: OmpA family protein [Pyrinomonadaceae bacterium]|jgi:OOP family OmpA-OmpF porin|nr:OmpA family protein [Pyrinomonadaceae bacterium]